MNTTDAYQTTNLQDYALSSLLAKNNMFVTPSNRWRNSNTALLSIAISNDAGEVILCNSPCEDIGLFIPTGHSFSRFEIRLLVKDGEHF
mmetsp:Transcript_30851/g.65194  ORF Transcript_30851/g.65194 Transcript_30851/m.65194 type:complete len:89 (-) Transcript_30851:5611-5877(-)